jgi:hypothetical protein
VAAAVPQHLHGLLDPTPAGRLALGLGHPLGVLALVGEGQAVEGGPGLGVGGQGAGQVGRRVDGRGWSSAASSITTASPAATPAASRRARLTGR